MAVTVLGRVRGEAEIISEACVFEVRLDARSELNQHGMVVINGMDQDPNVTSSRERTVLIVLFLALGLGLVAIPPVREGILKDFRRKWDQNGQRYETGWPLMAAGSNPWIQPVSGPKDNN